MPFIYESLEAKANSQNYRRRNAMYKLTNIDPQSEHNGSVVYHSAVTARRELGMLYADFYAIVAGAHYFTIQIEPVEGNEYAYPRSQLTVHNDSEEAIE